MDSWKVDQVDDVSSVGRGQLQDGDDVLRRGDRNRRKLAVEANDVLKREQKIRVRIPPGVNIMILKKKYFRRNKWRKSCRFWRKLIITSVFKRNANFFAENRAHYNDTWLVAKSLKHFFTYASKSLKSKKGIAPIRSINLPPKNLIVSSNS
jgi:hypothetical protein